MKQIAIKSKNLKALKEFFKEKKTETSIEIKDFDIILHLKDEKDKEDISLILAVFIINSVEQEFTNKLKSAIPKEKYNENVFINIQDKYRKFLYIDPIRILVAEHFKNNNKIDIESFITFNCRNLRKDFFEFGKDLLQLYQEELKNKEISIENLENQYKGSLSIDSAITYYSYIKELNDLIFKLKKECDINQIDYKRFNEIHLKSDGKYIVLTDKSNKVIDNELDNILPVNITKNLKCGDEILKIAISLITYISILNTSCIIIHKSISDEIINRILLYLYDSREVNPELLNVNLLQCNKCSKCNLTT